MFSHAYWKVSLGEKLPGEVKQYFSCVDSFQRKCSIPYVDVFCVPDLVNNLPQR